MSKQDVAAQVKLTPSQKAGIAAAILAGLLDAYAGQIRVLLHDVGAPDRPVTVTDRLVIAALTAFAGREAATVIRASNAMIDSALKGMANRLSDDQYLARLAVLIDTFQAHNKKTLVPYWSATAQQRATEDFVRRNGLEQHLYFEVQPPSTDMTDVCLEAISAGTMTYEEASGYFGVFPAHQNCPHELVAVVPSIFSAPEDLWTGDNDQSDQEAA